jgi:hypothetical protein
LKLQCDEPLSNCAFNFNVRRYTMGNAAVEVVREIYVLSPCSRPAECPTRSLCPALSTDREMVCETCDDYGNVLCVVEQSPIDVGRCRLTVSKPALKAPMASELKPKI